MDPHLTRWTWDGHGTEGPRGVRRFGRRSDGTGPSNAGAARPPSTIRSGPGSRRARHEPLSSRSSAAGSLRGRRDRGRRRGPWLDRGSFVGRRRELMVTRSRSPASAASTGTSTIRFSSCPRSEGPSATGCGRTSPAGRSRTSVSPRRLGCRHWSSHRPPAEASDRCGTATVPGFWEGRGGRPGTVYPGSRPGVLHHRCTTPITPTTSPSRRQLAEPRWQFRDLTLVGLRTGAESHGSPRIGLLPHPAGS